MSNGLTFEILIIILTQISRNFLGRRRLGLYLATRTDLSHMHIFLIAHSSRPSIIAHSSKLRDTDRDTDRVIDISISIIITTYQYHVNTSLTFIEGESTFLSLIFSIPFLPFSLLLESNLLSCVISLLLTLNESMHQSARQ